MYKVVAEKHNEREFLEFSKKTFFPQSTVLYSIISFSNTGIYVTEWDINECLSYQEKPGNWLILQSHFILKNNLNHFSYLNYDLCFS